MTGRAGPIGEENRQGGDGASDRGHRHRGGAEALGFAGGFRRCGCGGVADTGDDGAVGDGGDAEGVRFAGASVGEVWFGSV